MNKLKLRLDDLQVDTFSTTMPQKPKGTVFGEQCTCYTQCTCPGCPTCAGYGSCDASCNGTCDASCNGTCETNCNCTSYCETDTYNPLSAAQPHKCPDTLNYC